MGIPGFFKFIKKDYPKCISDSKDFKQKIDFLYFDINGIIHNSKHKNIKIMFAKIKKKFESIIDVVNPNFIFIAIDGVAPMAKITQQRARRFRNLTPQNDFDGNAITPGTKFMNELNFFFKEYIKDKKNFFFSGSDTPGEGEHKIMVHLRTLKNEKIMIYGSDADLIMLGIISHKQNVFIFREAEESHIINIRFFKNLIKSDLLINESYDYERVLDDWVFLCFLIGNDFLPHLPGLEIKNIWILFDLHKTILLKTKKYLTYKGTIPLNHIILIMKHLNILLKNFNFNYYKTNFLLEESDVNFIKLIVNEYCKGLMWVLKYYYEGCPDWNWFYPFYYAPLVEDFALADIKVVFKLNKPLKPMEQLMCVIPIGSKKLLPKKYYDLMTADDSCITDFYPIKFKGMKDWRHVAILPFIDIGRLRRELKKVQKK